MVDITRNAITWTITGSPTNGTFLNGDPWVVDSGGGVEVTAISPAPTGTGASARNGSMINPTTRTHNGYDGRTPAVGTGTFVYSDAYNDGLDLPLTLVSGQSLCSSVSANPGGAMPGDSSNPVALTDMSVLTVLASNPGATAFRPPYMGTTKTLWTQADVDYGKLPNLAPPVASGSGGFPVDITAIGMGSRLIYDFHPVSSVGTTLLRPSNNLNFYPGNIQTGSGSRIVQLAMIAISNEANAQTAANRLTQIGIDYYHALLLYPDQYVYGGGFGQGYMLPILFAGHMLGDSGMLEAAATTTGLTLSSEPIPPFQEQASYYYSASAYSQYRLPRLRNSYPSGPPLYGDMSAANTSRRDASGVYDGCGTEDGANPYYPYPTLGTARAEYMQANACWGLCPTVLTLRALGIEEKMHSPESLDFADRWANDNGLWAYFDPSGVSNNYGVLTTYHKDIYGFGGTGNGFVSGMWDTYRYPNNSRKIFVF
jgi:hypothetical protein